MDPSIADQSFAARINKHHNNGCYPDKSRLNAIKMDFNSASPSEIMAALGGRLRAHRLAREFAQCDLASMAGLSLGALRKLERDGQCSLETLVRVAQALGLSEEMAGLFSMKSASIAPMAQAVHARQRAPRRRG